MQDSQTQDKDLTDEEVKAVRDNLRRAIKAPVSRHAQSQGYWRQPATQWDVVKFLVPFVVAIAMWAVRIEIYQTRTDGRFDSITSTLSQQSETLKGINAALKDMADSRLQSRERLASIEAKVDMILNEQRSEKKMSFYEKYLKGVDMGKFWPSVVLPTVAAYNGFLAYGIKQLPAVGLAATVFVSSLVTFLVVPKTPQQLATEPRIVAETVRATVAPVVAEVQSQVADAVSDTVEDARSQVQEGAADVAETVRTATDPVKDMADRLEKAAAILRGEAL